MCGIFFFSDESKKNFDLVENQLAEITQTIQRRGPNHQVVHNGSFGNRHWISMNSVLSIRSGLDVPSTSLLPTRYSEAFLYNGESYEPLHRGIDDTAAFRSLIDRPASSFPGENYQGFFAFCKLSHGVVEFGVDYLAEKALFYWTDGASFCVASDIATIVKVATIIKKPCSLNKKQLREYFFTRHLIMFNQTAYTKIRKCMPGQKYRFDLSANKKYFPTTEGAIEDIYCHYNKLVNQNFSKARLPEITDAYLENATFDLIGRNDVGYVLSGGVDSTLVALSMAEKELQHARKIKTFTLEFGAKDSPAIFAKDIAAEKDTSHTSLQVEQDYYRETLDNLYVDLLIPMPTHSFPSYSVLCSLAKDNGTRILVGGEGADEIFNGYTAYKNISNPDSGESYSVSPYSSFSDQFELFDGVEEEMADLKIAHCVMKQQTGDDISNRITSSLFLDAVVQLSSTGLFAADQIGGLHGIESRSPLANPFAIAARLNIMLRGEWGAIYDGKKNLTDKLCLMSEAYKQRRPPKQGFSGFPNEIFDDKRRSDCTDIVCDFFSDNSFRSETLLQNPSFCWKICNLGSFLSH